MSSVTKKKKKKKSKVIGSCQPESGNKLTGKRYNSQNEFQLLEAIY